MIKVFLPTPLPARYKTTGEPNPPAPITKTFDSEIVF